MKYTVAIDLDLPRDRAIELFDDAENLVKWQRGLEVLQHLDGEPGLPGARTRMVFQSGKRRLEIVETITRRDLPDTLDCVYDAKGVHNVVRNRFTETAPEQTLWEAEHEFVFSGLMRIVGFLAKKAFPRQSQKYMADFKAFAEDGVDVRD